VLVCSEKVRGARTDRPEVVKVLRRLGEGDVLMVTRLDRLARSTRDLLNILDTIGKAGAGFKSLADAWADTTTAHGRLMLTVLGGLAEFERELIAARPVRAGSAPRPVGYVSGARLPISGRKPSSDSRKALRRPISPEPMV
jgi:DNA invertase Pin-like site-specific DNA recombinase